MTSTVAAYEIHANRQTVAARQAFDELPATTRQAMIRKKCAPAELVKLDDGSTWQKPEPRATHEPLFDHDAVCPEPLPGESEPPVEISDALLWQLRAEAADELVEQVIPALLSNEPPSLVSAVLAILKGEYGAKLRLAAVAAEHGASYTLVKRFGSGLKRKLEADR